MIQARKDQLNRKLQQIYNNSGRIEGIIESLLQEQFLGHTYYAHEIGATREHHPIEEDDHEDKTYTFIEIGLYQEGDSCIATFEVPVSQKVLQDIGARIDMAYYQWMQREPQTTKRIDPYKYYSDLVDASLYPEDKLSKQDFNSRTAIELFELLTNIEFDAFLPPKNTGTNMEEK